MAQQIFRNDEAPEYYEADECPCCGYADCECDDGYDGCLEDDCD